MYAVKRKLAFIGLVLSIGLLQGCDDVIAVNISNETPQVIIPSAGATVSNPVHFKWEAMEGATRYRLEIASPSFSNITAFVVDSIVIGNELYLSLDSNSYEMRLTAYNAGYTSLTSSVIPFTVGSGPDQSGSTVTLSSPTANATLSSTTVTFTWNSLPNIESYAFELHSGTSFAAPVVYSADQLGTVSLTLNNLTDSVYTWGVKAYFTDHSETVFSKRTFRIDTLAPSQPILQMPSDNSLVNSGSNTFSWTNAAGENLNSLLEIATDQQFNTIFYSGSTQGNSLSVTVQSPDVYYWRVTSTDNAGNSSVSDVFTFTLF